MDGNIAPSPPLPGPSTWSLLSSVESEGYFGLPPRGRDVSEPSAVRPSAGTHHEERHCSHERDMLGGVRPHESCLQVSECEAGAALTAQLQSQTEGGVTPRPTPSTSCRDTTRSTLSSSRRVTQRPLPKQPYHESRDVEAEHSHRESESEDDENNDESYRESESDDDDECEPTSRTPRKRMKSTHSPEASRQSRIATAHPCTTAAVAFGVQSTAQAVAAGEARPPVAPERRISSVPMTALQRSTEAYLARLTPQERARIPKDVHYYRVGAELVDDRPLARMKHDEKCRLAAEARRRASIPLSHRRSSVPVTPALRRSTQAYLSGLTPEERARMPKDILYGRMEAPMEVEPGDDPLLLVAPRTKRTRRQLEQKSTSGHWRRSAACQVSKSRRQTTPPRTTGGSGSPEATAGRSLVQKPGLAEPEGVYDDV